VSDTAASYLGAPKAARLRRALAHPPYRAIMAYYYEAQEYVIILDASHALNVWFGDDSDVDIYDMRRQK
jgi:hypothetical protein